MSPLKRLILFTAEGFGSGRFPIAPGTVGTLVGFLWIYLLLLPQNVWLYLLGTALGLGAAVWVGGKGEEISGKKDPGSIVIDEIAALPVAFLGSVLAEAKGGWTPQFSFYLQGWEILGLAGAFAGFRLFDITKPWLIGKSQNLPGGWGLVFDDFLAALPVAPICYLITRAVS